MPSLVTEDRAVNYKTLGFIIIPLRFYISGYSEFKVIPLIKNIKWFLYLVLERDISNWKVMKHTQIMNQINFCQTLSHTGSIWVNPRQLHNKSVARWNLRFYSNLHSRSRTTVQLQPPKDFKKFLSVKRLLRF